MRIVFLKESDSEETRVAVSPESVTSLTNLNAQVVIQSGLGEAVGWSDTEYTKAGASVESDAGALLAEPALFPAV